MSEGAECITESGTATADHAFRTGDWLL